MERLTFEHEGKKCFYCGDEDGSDCECKVCSVDCAVCNPCPVEQTVIDRLAAYEDTWLTPEEIERILDAYGRGMTLRTENTERLRLVKDISTDRLKNIAEAEQDGRLVELPCKIGDAVWTIKNFKGHERARIGYVSEMFYTKYMKLFIVVKNTGRGFWGEGVFPSEAEAEAAVAALERREETT